MCFAPTRGDSFESWAAVLVRINPREAEVPAGGIALRLGARDALTRIDALLESACANPAKPVSLGVLAPGRSGGENRDQPRSGECPSPPRLREVGRADPS